MAIEIDSGIGLGVAKRTVLRQDKDGKWEDWGDVAKRVSLGNVSLIPNHLKYTQQFEYEQLNRHMSNGTIILSGRHLQHGDETQKNRSGDVFVNCSTSSVSFALFGLLLNGAGVGRCYDDDMMLVNWDHAPQLRPVLSPHHPDYIPSVESVRDAKHKYNPSSPGVEWVEVEDSREGWAKLIEIWETKAFEKIHKNSILVADFTPIRKRGTPIGGMQHRPAPGPIDFMLACQKCVSVIGSNMEPWLQTLYIDHYLADCVLSGGTRRSSRIATKFWKDKSIFKFIDVKRPIEYAGKDFIETLDYRRKHGNKWSFLWSSNNSVAVDSDFWECLDRGINKSEDKWDKYAVAVFNASMQAAYGDGTGEPGFLNVDRLVRNDKGINELLTGDFIGNKSYQINDDTKLLLSKLSKLYKKKKYVSIPNPCGEISLNAVHGGYCNIGDVVPFHAETLDDAEQAFRTAAKALMRVNLMDFLYNKEVKRTNRIGVGMTGVQEFAWKFFQYSFKDLLDEEKSKDFWLTLQRFALAVDDECEKYAELLGVNFPHTNRTVKPSGCVTTDTIIRCEDGYFCLDFLVRYMGYNLDDYKDKENVWLRPKPENPDFRVYDVNGDLKKVTGIYINGMKDVYEVNFKNCSRTIFATAEHKFLTKRGWKRTDQISLSDEFYVDGENWVRLEHPVYQDEEKRFTVDIEVEGTHSYQLENGVISHNSVSKIFNLTEGWHLPAKKFYLRWVQFTSDHPMVETYRRCGYPTRILKTYQNTTIVGFPTAPKICQMGLGEQLTTSTEATLEEQYKWLQLGEKYWIRAGKETNDTGNQISYTMKFNPAEVSFEDFCNIIREKQRTIRCCSFQPIDEIGASYEYLPEEEISQKEYDELVAKIKKPEELTEEVDRKHVDCENGACPVDFKES